MQINDVVKIVGLYFHGEVRKAETITNSFTGKNGQTVESKAVRVSIDDDDENRIVLYDRGSDYMDKYRKGMTGTFKIRLDAEMKSIGFGAIDKGSVLIVDFQEDKQSLN